MNDTLVKVENVSKKFCRSLKKSLWYGMKDLGSELIGRTHGGNDDLRPDEFWAVNDVSFELKRGECLGLIGRNGAGKTTLLKMLNGLIKPDKGRIEMRGRVGALIALGAGFNPILTGRENIHVNASVLGLKKREIDARFDEIVEFAELDEFIDTPVQNYSSGMQVRLGFAVATTLEPDILLVDEVLSVGDLGFVLKCLNRIDKILKNTCIVFVSHRMPQVARISDQIILLNGGKMVYHDSDVSGGINKYYSMVQTKTGALIDSDEAKLTSIELESGSKKAIPDKIFTVTYGEELKIILDIKLDISIDNPHLYMAFHDREQRNFAEIFSSTEDFSIKNKTGRILIEATIQNINFSQGIYSIAVGLTEKKGGKVLFRHNTAAYFQIKGAQQGWAPVQINPSWKQHHIQ